MKLEETAADDMLKSRDQSQRRGRTNTERRPNRKGSRSRSEEDPNGRSGVRISHHAHVSEVQGRRTESCS